MGLPSHCLPMATPYDPAEDPPSSVDPLGTLGTAERIADVLLPGMTARMWRPRLLTFAALATAVAGRATERENGDEQLRLEVRLGFERIFVSALVRRHQDDHHEWYKAVRRLPGRTLAYRALESSNEPLTRSNFLKGQAVNGPFGVMGRLVRHMDIVDDDDQLGRAGEELLLAFAKDEELPGLLDDGRNGAEGAKWLDTMARFTANHVTNGKWGNRGWDWWYDIAERLRPDRVGRQEVKVLRRLVADDPLRARCVAVLRGRETIKTFLNARKEGGRGDQDRQTLMGGILPALQPDAYPDDRTLVLAIQLADVYERTACLMQTALAAESSRLARHSAAPSDIHSRIRNRKIDGSPRPSFVTPYLSPFC